MRNASVLGVPLSMMRKEGMLGGYGRSDPVLVISSLWWPSMPGE